MKSNYVVFLLLFEGVASHSLMMMERYDEKYEEKKNNTDKEDFDITLSCCGYQDPILDRRRRETNIRSPREHGIDVFFPRLTKRDIKKHTCFTPRIVGGEESRAHSWPWMVAIFRTRYRDRHLCGGSLISQKFVLTAAHCFDYDKYPNPSAFVVKMGSHSVAKDGKEYAIKNILIHPEYQKGHHYNDIALLKVKGKVKLSDKIYPVCLPSNGEYERSSDGGINTMTVTGWGTIEYKGEASEVLMEVKVPEVSLESCHHSYSHISLKGISKGITSEFICAGFEDGAKDACQGDSGGPLIKFADGRWFQFGIVSFGYGCARPGFPGVYTRISKYTKWLYEKSDLKMDLI